MKKLSLWAMTAMMLLTLVPTTIKAETGTLTTPASTPIPAENAMVNTMVTRLNEIKMMDIKSMNSSQKKELRKEVRAIKSDLKKAGEGVYLSVGAIIIIILLLILIL
jgi:hypothetical protein